MKNVVAMTGTTAMTRLARWLRAGALVACIGQRLAALFTRRVGAAWWTSVGPLPPVRQQLALCRFVWNATASSDDRGDGERMSRQALQA